MRVVICGDTHIGAVFGLGGPNGSGGNTRVDDYEKTLNYIVDYTINSGADVFIQTGDAFDVRNPAPEHISIFNRALRKLSRANITSIVIMGNHDYKRSGDGFTSSISSLNSRFLPNVRIVLEPEVVKLNKTTGDALDIVLLPFRDRRMYEGKTTEHDSVMFDRHMSKLIDSCSGKRPIIAIGHNFFYEGSYNDYGGTEVLSKVDTYKKCDLVAMGHYHGFRKIRQSNPIAFYTGSMEKLNFGDEKSEKFFFDYDTVEKNIKVLKTPVRQIKDILSDLSMVDLVNFRSELRKEIESLDLNDKVIRYKIITKDGILNIIKKSEIEKMLYDNGAFYVSRVNIEPVIKRMVRDDKILKQSDEHSMFSEFVKTQDNLEKGMVEFLIKEAKEIMKQEQ